MKITKKKKGTLSENSAKNPTMNTDFYRAQFTLDLSIILRVCYERRKIGWHNDHQEMKDLDGRFRSPHCVLLEFYFSSRVLHLALNLSTFPGIMGAPFDLGDEHSQP